MRISDWSSDVCSSDLIGAQPETAVLVARAARHPLPRDMAVGIGEGDREPIEPALMDHERDIAAIDGQRTQIGAQPETAVLVARGRATTRERQGDRKSTRLNSSH